MKETFVYRQEHIRMSEIAECLNAYSNGTNHAEYVACIPDLQEYGDGEARCYLVFKHYQQKEQLADTFR